MPIQDLLRIKSFTIISAHHISTHQNLYCTKSNIILKLLIIHEASTKKINTVEDVWKSEEKVYNLGQLSP